MGRFFVVCHGDLDGVACAMLAADFNKDAIIHFKDYNNVNQFVIGLLDTINPEQDWLWVLDLGLKLETCKAIEAKFRPGNWLVHVRLVDHHKSNEHLLDFDWCIYEEGKCGAELTLEMLRGYGDHIDAAKKHFVDVVSAWDLWKLDSPHRSHAESLETLRKFLGNRRFMHRDNKFTTAFDEKEAWVYGRLVEGKENYIKVKVDRFKKDSWVEGNVAMIFISKDIGEVCTALLDAYPEVNYIANAHLEYGKVELRSTQGSRYDVSLIAKLFHGGGHKHAAGFPMVPKMVGNLGVLFGHIVKAAALFDAMPEEDVSVMGDKLIHETMQTIQAHMRKKGIDI